jgi:hypothetical protein
MFSLAAILRPDKPRQRPRARAWDGTDLRRRCGGIKTIDEIVRPNNRRGVDDHRRLCFSSFAKLDNLTVYSAGILPLFRGGRFCWLSAARTFALFDLCSRSWLQAVSQSGSGRRSFATRSNAHSLHNRDMKPPPDVIFHRAERLMVWIPHGVMDAQRIEQLVNALAHEEALAQTYFHRFSDFSFVDRVNLDFDYVFNAALLRRLTHASGPKVKSALVVKSLEAIHYSKLYATLTERSSLYVRLFNNLEAAASWLGFPVALLSIPEAPSKT